MPDKIVKLLMERELRERVVRGAREAHEHAVGLYRLAQDDPEVDFAEIVATWEQAWWNQGYQNVEVFWLRGVLEKGVMEKLGKPHRVTLSELLEGFIQLCGIDPDDSSEVDFDVIYAAFVHRVSNHGLENRQSDPFPISRLPKSADYEVRRKWYIRGAVGMLSHLRPETGMPAPEEPDEDGHEPLWCRSSVSLRMVGTGYPATDRGSSVYGLEPGPALYAAVNGPMTPSALAAVRAELEVVVPSVLRSAAFLETKRAEDGAPPRYPHPRQLPHTTEDLVRRRGPLLRSCLDAYYTDATKRDSMDRRIRNAVHLLVEADAQASDAVALSLSVAAIEALLGRGSGEIKEKLAADVAVLLEPDLDLRDRAEDYVRKLYKDRSETLHGSRIEGEPQVRAQARHLAAAVLEQLIFRGDFMRRSGCGREKPSKLLDELRKSKYRSGQAGPAPETNARLLWGGR